MEQSIGADHLSRRVAQDRELAVDNFLPDQTGVLTVIYTDCHNPRIQRIEVFFVGVRGDLFLFPLSILTRDGRHAPASVLHEKEMRFRNVRREETGYVIEAAEKKAS
jgi:hypothetical protein